MNSELTLENILLGSHQNTSHFLDIGQDLSFQPHASEDSSSSDAHFLSNSLSLSSELLPSARELSPDIGIHENRKSSSETMQNVENSNKECATNLSSNQPEENLVNPESSEVFEIPRPSSPQTLSERLTNAGISDDLIGI